MNYKIFLLTLLFYSGYSALAQEVKSDAVYQEQTKEYTLNKDGSWTYHYSHKLLINTYMAFHSLYGEDYIVYDPAFQKLKINHSVTTMADGKQVATPDNAYNELLPGFAANVPAWNRLREMVVTHTALERGATIDFDYLLTSAKGYMPAVMVNEQLMMNSPVKKLAFIVHVPAGAAFNYEQYNLASKPIVTKIKGIVTYTWTLTDLAATLHEDFRLREQQNRPRIVFTASTKSTDLIAGFATQEAFKCDATPDVKEAASKIIKGIDQPLSKALKLQEKVASELNTWQVPLQNTGYKLRNAAVIWQSNGGIEAEKAILLTAMLRSQNIQAEPVVVLPERFYTKKTANPAMFERTLVKVSLTGMEPVFLSPTTTDQQDMRFALAGKRIISLIPGKSQPSEIISESKNILSISGNLKLDIELTLSGNMNIELGARLNPWLKIQKDSSFATSYISGMLANSKITGIVKGKTDIDLSSFSFNLNGTSFASEKAGHVFLKLPSASIGTDSWHMTELVSTRVEPLEIPITVNESYDVMIAIPDGMTLLSAPVSLTMNNEFGSLAVSVSMEGNQLHVVRNIKLEKSEIPVEKYDAFRSLINAWNSKKCREVVLKKALL